MKFRSTLLCSAVLFISIRPVFAQTPANCFLVDFEPKSATVPLYEDVEKTTEAATVTITLNAADTLGKVSKYIFGHALAAWLGNDVINPVLLRHLQKLSPALIRYPGGSWSDIFFWNGNPGDLPNSIPDGGNNGQLISLSPQFGANSWTTTLDNYYLMRDQVHGTQGLITINYGYARYGLSAKPAEQAAHYAAEWVRRDAGRTKFWEIGNENAGPWEAGWQIDTTANQDGQPQIISGELYGKHFKIFADSMRAAAAKLGVTIYLGGQILHYDGTTSWNVVDRKWNEGFFKEAGDAPDFYVIHNYFGNRTSSIKNQIDVARSTINQNITFIRQDLVKKQAPARPVALTEWNLDVGSDADNLKRTSIANGMQAVVLIGEMIKNNFGMSSRWLIANWESDGMFYKGNNSSIPTWNPRPDFFYMYYLQRIVGDHAVRTSVAGSTDVLAYATSFSSKHAGVVVVNKGTVDQVVKLAPGNFGVGERFYIYSLTDGGDNSTFPQAVYVNDEGPASSLRWGPTESLEEIRAFAYLVGDEIKFVSPARSVQFILIEPGDRVLAVKNGRDSDAGSIPTQYRVYPNPATGVFNITLQRGTFNKVDVVDLMGRIVYSREITPSVTALQLQPKLASGSYFVRLYNKKEVKVTKLIISK
ncbi:MAG: hypothetical protein ALAOOOJD_04668 [bacterium]|nr:hypothetical protein [bacterium]